MPLSLADYSLAIRRKASARVLHLFTTLKGLGGLLGALLVSVVGAYLTGQSFQIPGISEQIVLGGLVGLGLFLVGTYVWALKVESHQMYFSAEKDREALADGRVRELRQRLKDAIDGAHGKVGLGTFAYFLTTAEYARVRDYLYASDVEIIEGRSALPPQARGENDPFRRKAYFLDCLSAIEREMGLIEDVPTRGLQVRVVHGGFPRQRGT